MPESKVIAIGASAGGIEALRVVLAALPRALPAAVLIVQHLSPQSPGFLPKILERGSTMPVASPVDGEKMRPGRVYVAPPDRHLLVEDGGVARLSSGPRENRFRPAVDPLFRSAALAFGPRVIGVVLTGFLDDGAAGLQAIKLCGGLAVVQDPSEAWAASMPASALAHVDVDVCLPLREIGPRLIELAQQPAGAAPGGERSALIAEAAFAGGHPPPLEEALALGEPTLLTCPECGGGLMRLRGAAPTRYRCHTGHAFTERALFANLAENTESAVWSAIRALREQAMLARRPAREAAARGDREGADHLEKKAADCRALADRMRATQCNLAVDGSA
ncbi:two-component system, chemotaxis family, response regulator CheB [Rhodoblastus acidophilus]|uniref:protein-glutamate methylesterase n=1 Tax=Rhodoblastus acidophilus TaxID=1074 RepID=A0A212R0D8_RHOAC|nr:chemotaxis protein CheB [Rhodoblastus acidophilus]PPQ40475.1 chemotaxis protein CheB [Rhodoblastus acidophilus]RAI23039.1 chemotaxis protein CheB [Rhodoblastus acidophilus]SNB65429.1 two-component system, chemotaxis family, response regulator CheB [Rhodoblastus acidophilus]